MNHTFIFLLLCLTISNACQKKQSLDNTPQKAEDTSHQSIDKEEQEVDYRAIHIKDSLACEQLYQKAWQFFQENKHQEHFKKLWKEDFLSLEWGHIFSPQYKHLLMIRRTDKHYKLDILIPQEDSLISQLRYWHETLSISLAKDTLFDVDGDGWRDYAQTFYGTSGCCLKNFYIIRFFQEDSCQFGDKIQLSNPTFFPKENMVRGVGYGYPGKVGLYKAQWKDKKLKTIEEVFPNPNEYSKFYRYNGNDVLIDSLNVLPTEYENIYGIKWFLSYRNLLKKLYPNQKPPPKAS